MGRWKVYRYFAEIKTSLKTEILAVFEAYQFLHNTLDIWAIAHVRIILARKQY